MSRLRVKRSRSRFRPVSSGASGYQYGYPTTPSPVEPNVAVQFLFDEASGDIVDEVASLTLADSGSPTYSVAFSGAWSAMTPGIRCSPAAGESAFLTTTDPAALVLTGTTDAVIEFTARFDDAVDASVGGATTGYFLNMSDSAGAPGIAISVVNAQSASSNIAMDVYEDGASGVNLVWVDPFSGAAPWVGGNATPNKYRFAIDRTADTVTLYIDGVSKGAKSIAAITGDTITPGQLKVGGRHDTFRPLDVTFTELRFTVGNKTNNSGGPGGG